MTDQTGPERRLLAMLFVDIVSSTSAAERAGDIGWIEVLDAFRARAGTSIDEQGGHQVKWTGDGLLATFTVPAAAIRCGQRLIGDARAVGLELRAGIHVGEVAWDGADLTGIAVHAAARIMSLAGASELLVSQTTVDVTRGADLSFVSRGMHRLKGLSGDWELFAPGGEPARGHESSLEQRPSDHHVALVDRDRELDALMRAFAGIFSGAGSVVVVSGEAGIGKTALVHSFVAGLPSAARVLVGACDDLLTPRPLGPIRDALDQAGLPLSPASGIDVVADRLDALLSEPVPTVLVVEDLHWADEATLDAVRHVCVRLRARPTTLLVLLTFRSSDVGAGHPLRRLLGALVGSAVTRLELGPLSEVAIARLPTEHPIDAEELHRITGGNPLFVTEVLAAGGDEVPPSIRDVVLARLERLSPEGQQLLRTMAVVPTRTERWLLDEVLGDVASRIAEAEAAGLAEIDQRAVWFRHELVRRSVEHTLPSSERLRLNERLLDPLINHGAEPARIVHHAAMAGAVDTVLTFGPLAAAEASAAGSYREAVAHLERVLAHPEHIPRRERAALLIEASHARYLVNRFDASNAAASDAVREYDEMGDAHGLATALINLARTTFWATGPRAAQEASGRALVVATESGDPELLALANIAAARAHSNLATLGPVAEPSDVALAHAQEALRLADEVARDDLRSQALNYRGTARLALGDPGGGKDLEDSIALASGLPRVEYLMRACVNASGGAYRSGRFADADRYVAIGLQAGEGEAEFYAGTYRLDLTTAAVRASCGDWAQARSVLAELLERDGEPGIMRTLVQVLLGRLLARQGDEGAADLLAAARAASVESTEVQLVAPVAAALAELAWLRAEPPDAFVLQVLHLTAEQQYAIGCAEITRYLQRIETTPEDWTGSSRFPEPWASAIAGDWRQAADGWARTGERYEHAVELALADTADASAAGRAELLELGATETLDRVPQP